MSDGILSRWARRKQAVRAAEQRTVPRENSTPASLLENLPRGPEAPSPEEADVSADASADALADAIARLPRLEDLTADTDLAPFLRAGIPSFLRNAALRRMWSLDPGIRDFVSEAREYAYDWNTPGGVPGLGPMLPTDDIKAMVARIMTGPAPAADAGETEAETTEPDRVADVPAGPVARDGEPAQAPAHAEPPAVIPPTEPVEPCQLPAIVSRLRRHGGAMPT